MSKIFKTVPKYNQDTPWHPAAGVVMRKDDMKPEFIRGVQPCGKYTPYKKEERTKCTNCKADTIHCKNCKQKHHAEGWNRCKALIISSPKVKVHSNKNEDIIGDFLERTEEYQQELEQELYEADVLT